MDHPAEDGASVRVTWLGHATALVELDGARILTDPVLTPQVGPLRNAAYTSRADAVLGDIDAVLVSHVHHDHLHLASLRRLPRGTRVIVPHGAGSLLSRQRHWAVEEVGVGESVRVGRVRVAATYADHLSVRNRRGRAVLALGYLLSGSRAVYFAGDTALFAGMRELGSSAVGGLAAALLPIGGWGLNLGPGHMDPQQAADAVALLRPRVAVPIHWGTLRLPAAWRMRPALFTEPGAAFARAVAERASGTEVRVAAPGQPMTLS